MPWTRCLDRQEVLDVKNTRTVLIGMLVTAITLFAFIAPAAAQFTHPNGILIATYPQNIVVFGGAPGNYEETLQVVIEPPWYFVPGLMGFTSVNLTLTLTGGGPGEATCYQCVEYSANPSPITLAGASNGSEVIQLGPTTMTEDMNGISILCPITFVINGSTSRGFYMLYIGAQADAADGTIFQGWTQIPVAIVRI